MKKLICLGTAPFFLALCLFSFPARAVAQSEKAPVRTVNRNLSDQERQGEGVFLQRCSLCHLPKVTKPYKSFGPSLTGVLKGASPAKEKGIRQFISLGVPDKMPGFQYALTSNDMDDLIAYLKTL